MKKAEPAWPRSDSLEIAGLVGVLGAALWVYRGAFLGFFVQDDFGWLGSSRFQSLSEYLQCFFRFNPAQNYRPLSQETFFWLGQKIFGLWPPGFHAVSVLFHLIAVALVYVLLRQFFSTIPSLAGVFFFAVHSAHFRSIYWIAALPEPMALVFYLTALLLFIRFDRNNDVRVFVLSVAAMGLGMMSKESILSLPLVLATYCALFARGRFWWTLPHFFLCALYAFLRAASDSVRAAPYPLTFGKEAFNNLLAYLSWTAGFSETLLKFKLGWPLESSYSLVAAFLAGAVLLLVRFSRNKQVAAFSLAWYLFALQPVLYFSEHIFPYYLAAALPAMSLLLSSALPPEFEKRRWKSWIPVFGLIGYGLWLCYPSVRAEGGWWNDRTFQGREILSKMPEVDRQLPPGHIAYILGFGPDEFGILQNDAAFRCYGFPHPRFILVGLDKRTEADIRVLARSGGLRDYYCFLYTRRGFTNVTTEFREDAETFLRALDSGAINFDRLHFLERPEVRLEVNSHELQSGEDFLALRVVNFDAPAIDLLYSIDEMPMPPLRRWRLDENHAARVFVDQSTRKGLYRIRAVRDSRDPSPDSWIRVDAEVLVK